MSAANYDYYSMEVLLNYNRHRDGKKLFSLSGEVLYFSDFFFHRAAI